MFDANSYYIKYYFVTILLLSLCSIFGKIILSFFSSNTTFRFHQRIFFQLVTGIISIVTIYSIFITKFNTINFAVLILSIIFLLYNFSIIKIPNLKLANLFSEAFIVVLLGTFWWAIIYFSQIFSISHNISPIIGDHIYYSKISESLNTFMKESNLDSNLYFLPKNTPLNLYHYFELWLNAFVINYFDVLTILSNYLIINVSFLAITSLGIIGIIESFSSSRISLVDYMWSFVLLGLKGIILTFVLSEIDSFYYNLFDMPKLSIIYILIIAYISLIGNKFYQASWFALLLLAIVYTPIAPVIIASLSICLLIEFIKNKFNKATWISFQFISLLCVVLYIGLFYGVINKGTSDIQMATFSSKVFNIRNYLKTFVDIIGKTTLQTGILYITFIVLLVPFLIRKKSNVKLLLYNFINTNFQLILIIITSLVLWAVVGNFIVASVEFFSSISIPIISIIFMVLVLKVVKKYNYKKYSLIPLSIIAILCVYFFIINAKEVRAADSCNIYSREYLSKINDLVKRKIINPYGGSILSPIDYEPNRSAGQYTLVYTNGLYLKYMKNNFNTISISPDSSSYYKAAILASSPINLFIREQIKNHIFKNTTQSQIDFIRKYNIQYLITSPHVQLDSVFDSLIDTQITDSISHDHFILLKPFNTNDSL